MSFLLTAIWASFHSFLYGYHIASLNGVQEAVTCQSNGSKWGVRDCVPLNPSQFGVVATIFTLGGLLGSLGADSVTRRYGRVGSLRIGEVMFALGTALVGGANVMWIMIIGRILIGIGSGLSMVSVPLLLSETSPSSYRASLGTVHQMAIGIGMITAQSLSIPFGKPWEWRWVLVIGFGIAAVLFAFSWGVEVVEYKEEEEEPLVERDRGAPIAVKELLHAEPEVKRGLLVVVAAQFGQQICGISPVMYFSTRIFEPIFQANSKLVALGIMAIGIPFNFVPALMPKSIGSRRLLLISSLGTAVTAILLGVGLNMHARALSAISVVGFVLLFSIGLAPIAWVVLSEVMPREARTAGGAVGVSINWLTNFAAGSSFLPIQEALKHGDRGEGNVFFVFSALSFFAFLAISIAYRLHDRVKEQHD